MQASPSAAGGAIAGGVFGAFMLIWGLMILAAIALTVLWIVAIVDCAQREFQDSNEKIIWILVIIFAHGIGALIYWIVGRPRGVRPGET